jgi:hypothetical protein
VVHLLPADAPLLGLALVVADAFLFNALLWAWAHTRRLLRIPGPHARAHAEAVVLAEQAVAEVEARWRAQGRTATEVAEVDAEIALRREERQKRYHAHALTAESLDLDVYWPRLDLLHLVREGFVKLQDPFALEPWLHEPSALAGNEVEAGGGGGSMREWSVRGGGGVAGDGGAVRGRLAERRAWRSHLSSDSLAAT